MQTGLVSISFRPLEPETLLQAAVKAGLRNIEWGSDVHAPYGDKAALEKIAALDAQYGVTCCSYGTYFRLGVTPLEELPGYIAAAKVLGTDILRLWCGDKAPEAYDPAGKAALFADCAQAAALAEAAGVTICLECHKKTYTETKEGALELMETVASPAFRMYWQPNQDRTIEENLEYLALLKPYITHLHVFQWKGKLRFPLRQGLEEWKQYLDLLGGDHALLLEFMPDDRVESLPEEAQALEALKGAYV